MALNNTEDIKYIYNLPYPSHRELCRILDQNDKWEELAGVHMKMSMQEVSCLRRPHLHSYSPTYELLALWGQRNHTVYELFVLLSKMQHHQAMLVLKPYIDRKYHVLINEGEENISRLLGGSGGRMDLESRRYSPASDSMYLNGNENVNISASKFNPQKFEEKILNVAKPIERAMPPTKCSPSPDECASKNLNTEIKGAILTEDPSSIPTRRAESELSGNLSVLTEASCGSSTQIPYKELYTATNHWDERNILGKGGFGTVFRGTWKQTQVAIKRIEQRGGSDAGKGSYQAQVDQSLKELKFLNTLRHDNILPLYGFSLGGDQPCLVYQLMPNGSLEDRLQCRKGTSPLTWSQRHSVALGTARGLQFLHTRDEKPLIHGDIKSANILLDSNWQPRIGDFGLAREGPIAKYTHVKVTSIHGTRPYLPDDFLRSRQTSTKVDTFSFGIVLFEIGTGQRAYDDKREPKLLRNMMRDASDVRQFIDQKAPFDPQNPSLGILVYQELITLGQKCSASNPKERPEMALVFQDLKNLEKQRNIVSRAQIVVQSPSPCPSNPLELQMFYEVLAHQRQASPDMEPWNACAASPNWDFTRAGTANTLHMNKALKVEIPNQEDNLSPQRYMPSSQTPGYHTQHSAYSPAASSIPPSISPSVNLPDYPFLSTPSTLPTSNPFPHSPNQHMGLSPNQFPPHYQHSPSLSPHTNNSSLHPAPLSVNGTPLAASPLLMYQNNSMIDSCFDSGSLPPSEILEQHNPLQIPHSQPQVTPQPQVAALESVYLPDLSALGIHEDSSQTNVVTSNSQNTLSQSQEQENAQHTAVCQIPHTSTTQ